MIESAEGIWEPFEEGRSIGQVGSEGGRIIRDDLYTHESRICLEVVSRTRFLRTRTSYTITCGIYGWMVHTRFFESEAEARDEFEKMKPSLSAVVERLRLASANDMERVFAEISPEIDAFISRFP